MSDHILAIDVGGSGIKAATVDSSGTLQSERVRVETPTGSHPDDVVAAIVSLVSDLDRGDRVAIGFPGMVRRGRVLTAPNLGHDAWAGYPLAEKLGAALGARVRLANDADVQGMAVVSGEGVEMVLTLGTGFGTALFDDGRLCPHLELAHLRFRKGETFEEQLGESTREQVGTRRWRKRVGKAIDSMRVLTHFDRLYIGGGNSRRLDQDDLPDDVTLVANQAGIEGGARLWTDARVGAKD